jgi:hypothetical protein
MNPLDLKHHNSATFVATIVPRAGESTITVEKAWFTVKANKEHIANVLQKVSPSGGIGLTNNGSAVVTVTITILPTDTLSLPFVDQALLWELQIKETGGGIYTVLDGHMDFKATVTREVS